MLDIIASICCAGNISRMTSCSLSAYCLFLKLSYYWTHILRFIQQNIYGQTVTMVSFCRSEQKFNTASALQCRGTLWMYLNDRKNTAFLSVTSNKQQTSGRNQWKMLLTFSIKNYFLWSENFILNKMLRY